MGSRSDGDEPSPAYPKDCERRVRFFAMTQYPATRTAPAPSSAGIDLKTLLITAVSSAAAAYTCSKLWAPGTLAAAAFTPVLVAVIREALAKSTAVVVKAVPVKGVVRSAVPEGPRAPDATAAGTGGGWTAADLAAGGAGGEPPRDALLAEDPATRVAQPGEISYHGTGNRARNWRIAIITGLLGFLIAAVVFTVPELVSGSSASGGGRSTTLFGGSKHSTTTPAETTTTTTAPPETVTTPPEETVTVPPQTVTTPPPATTTPEVDPGQTTPDQAETTPTEPPPVAEPPPPADAVPPG